MIAKVGIFTEKGLRRNAITDYARAWDDPGPDDPGGQMFVLADGVGRGNLSELASQYVCLQIRKLYYQLLEKKPETTPTDALDQVIRWTNKRLRQHADDQMALNDMGASVVVAVMIRSQILIAWTGNCRGYYMRGEDGYARSVTEDHWMPDKKTGDVVPVYMGLRKKIPVQINAISIYPGDALVLCTDGIYRYLTPDEVVEIVDARMSPQMAASDLAAAAFERERDDDATAMVIQIHADNEAAKKNADETLYASYDEISKLLADSGVLLDTVETMQVAVEDQPAPIPPFLAEDFDWSEFDVEDDDLDGDLSEFADVARLMPRRSTNDTQPLEPVAADAPPPDDAAALPDIETDKLTPLTEPEVAPPNRVLVSQSAPLVELVTEDDPTDSDEDPLGFIDAYDDFDASMFDDVDAPDPLAEDDIADPDPASPSIPEPDFLADDFDLAMDDDAEPVAADLSFLDAVDIDSMVFDDEPATAPPAPAGPDLITGPDLSFLDDTAVAFSEMTAEDHREALLAPPAQEKARRRMMLIGLMVVGGFVLIGLVAAVMIPLSRRAQPPNPVAVNVNESAANQPKGATNDVAAVDPTLTNEPTTADTVDSMVMATDTPTDASATAVDASTQRYEVPNGWAEGTVLYITTPTGVRANVFSDPVDANQYAVGDSVTVSLARQTVGYREWYELEGQRWWFVDRVGWLAESELSATPPG